MTRLLLVGALLLGSACGSLDDDRPPTLPYVTEAILAPTCGQAECHSQFADQVGDEFDTVASARRTLTLYSMVTYTTHPDDSYLITVLTKGVPSIINPSDPTPIRMPYDGPIPDYDLDLIQKWIASGPPGGIGPVGAQCLPGPNDDSTQGCNTLEQLVECDQGTQGALVMDCTKVGSGDICVEGACVAQ